MTRRKPALCWRCERVPVVCYGVTCLECRAVIHAEYDRLVVASGGHLLFIPDDWDGPALNATLRKIECVDCHESFSVKKSAPARRMHRCPECLAKHRRGPGRKPNPWDIDTNAATA